MDYQQVLKCLAPCGLDCSRCSEYKDGEIKELSADLLQALGNYGRLAKMKSQINPAFANFDDFKEILSNFSKASCGGCRSDRCFCPTGCEAKTCHKEKEVDFCFECNEFPCEKQNNPILRERWLQKNQRMKEIGVIEFYLEQLKLPRY